MVYLFSSQLFGQLFVCDSVDGMLISWGLLRTAPIVGCIITVPVQWLVLILICYKLSLLCDIHHVFSGERGDKAMFVYQHRGCHDRLPAVGSSHGSNL